jgi:hypothetical protein
MVDLIRATAMYLCSYCRHFMVLIPLESRGKNLFIHVYKSKWPKISLSQVLTQPVLLMYVMLCKSCQVPNKTCPLVSIIDNHPKMSTMGSLMRSKVFHLCTRIEDTIMKEFSNMLLYNSSNRQCSWYIAWINDVVIQLAKSIISCALPFSLFIWVFMTE